MGLFWWSSDRGKSTSIKTGKRSSCDQLLMQLKSGSVKRIDIVTTDAGPFEDDVFWRFQLEDDTYLSASHADQRSGQVLEECQKLDHFDNDAFINAMVSAENAVFHVWSRGE